MAIKTIEYEVNIAGIIPATEQFGGTQGDHRVVELNYLLTDELYLAATKAAGDSRLMYRFDVFDGEGGVWSSDAAELTENTVDIELEERHTRHGGKITVYLVITALSADDETQVELYSFPAVIRLKNRPEGVYQEGESYESITALAQTAKSNANDAAKSAAVALEGADECKEYAQNANDALKNINSAIKDSTDQTYTPESENAQSGKAVAEAVDGYVKKVKGNGHTPQVYAIGDHDNEYNDTTLDVEVNGMFEAGFDYGTIPCRQLNGNLMTNTPNKDLDCANKKYVDYIVGDIETLLGGI